MDSAMLILGAGNMVKEGESLAAEEVERMAHRRIKREGRTSVEVVEDAEVVPEGHVVGLVFGRAEVGRIAEERGPHGVKSTIEPPGPVRAELALDGVVEDGQWRIKGAVEAERRAGPYGPRCRVDLRRLERGGEEAFCVGSCLGNT